MPNLADVPRYRLAERRAILQRVYNELISSKDCRIPFKSAYVELSKDESANWEARQTVIEAMAEIPFEENLQQSYSALEGV